MKNNIKNSIHQYIENTISEEDFIILTRWVAEGENEKIFRKYIREYYRNNSFNIEAVYKRFDMNILEENKKSSPVRKPSFSVLKYVAIFIGILISSYASYQFFDTKAIAVEGTNEVSLEVENEAVQFLNSSNVKKILTKDGIVVGQQEGNKVVYEKGVTENELIYNTLKVPYGKKFELELSDGTLVYLNAGSSLRYPIRFKEAALREVFLTGEGFFKVAKNENSAFLVKTAELNTEVFGTEFNISAYPEDNLTEVVLVEGSIGVFNDAPRFEETIGSRLRPNEMAIKSTQDNVDIQEVDASQHIAWVNDQLVFKNEKFSTIVKKLERHYNVEIINNYKALEDKKFTGKFDIESMEQILNTFRRTNNFAFTLNEHNVIINP